MIGKDEVEAPGKQGGKGSVAGTVAMLAIVFLPGAIVAGLIYLLLRKGRLRISVISLVVLAIEIVLLASWFISGAADKAKYVFSDIMGIADTWPELVPAYLIVAMALGGVFGLIAVAWEIRQMRVNPHRLLVAGSWMYKFKYRPTPLQIFRRKKTIEGLKSGSFAAEDKAPLGLDELNNDCVAYRYNTEAIKQNLIVGASGSGKTITLLSLMMNDIKNGMPVIVIDFKRSPEMASKLAAWTQEAGGNFYHFVNGSRKSYDVKNSPGQSSYDPLLNGSATAKADMVLGMREYDTASAVYKAAMQQLLQVLFSMLKYADRSKAPSIDWAGGGIAQVASAVTEGNIIELADACVNTPIQNQAEAIATQAKGKTQIRHAMEELQGQMRTIVASEYGRWLRRDEGGRNIDLFELTKGKGNVILFSLNSDAEPDFARYVGAMILSDLTGVSAKRRNGKLTNQVNVYVDEFQAVPPTSVTSLLEKSRESRVAMTLAQQSFEQIIAASERNGEAYLLSILDTCSNFIVHNGATEDSAERLSKILGKHWVTSYRQANQNESSFFSNNWSNKRNQTIQTSEEERWVFEPRQFMSLSSPDKNNGFKSTAVLINKTSSDPLFRSKEGGATARKVWMIPNDKVISEYYTPTFDGDEDDDDDYAVSAPALISSTLSASAKPTANQNRMAVSEPEPDYYADEPEPVYIDDLEESEGGYGWEVLDDNEDKELMEASALPVISSPTREESLPEPEPLPTRLPVSRPPARNDGKRSALESSSFDDVFKSSSFKPVTRQDLKSENRTPEKTNTSQPKRNEPLPSVEEDIDIDSMELPPLDLDN